MADNTAVIIQKRGEPRRLENLPIPESRHGSAVIEVLATSVSPGAKGVLSEHFPLPLRTPVTPSSSFIGRIHAVGPDATKLEAGNLVFVDFFVFSRDDNNESILQGYMGGNDRLEEVWSNGSYAKYAQVPLERVWRLNEEVLVGKLGYSFVDLSFLGAICIPLAGLLDAETRVGDTVIVAPATGYFGGSAINAAIALGAKVIACGRNEEALASIAKTFESTNRISTVRITGDIEKDTETIKSLSFEGRGADVYVDFSPNEAAKSTHIKSSIMALKPFGKAVLMGGIFQDVSVPYFWAVRNNIQIRGRYMFDHWHAEQAIKLVEVGSLKLGSGESSGVVAKTFKLEDFEKALDEAERSKGFGTTVVLVN